MATQPGLLCCLLVHVFVWAIGFLVIPHSFVLGGNILLETFARFLSLSDHCICDSKVSCHIAFPVVGGRCSLQQAVHGRLVHSVH